MTTLLPHGPAVNQWIVLCAAQRLAWPARLPAGVVFPTLTDLWTRFGGGKGEKIGATHVGWDRHRIASCTHKSRTGRVHFVVEEGQGVVLTVLRAAGPVIRVGVHPGQISPLTVRPELLLEATYEARHVKAAATALRALASLPPERGGSDPRATERLLRILKGGIQR